VANGRGSSARPVRCMASGVIYYDGKGVERFQPAEVVILAANGIGTPRLLLNSASARFPTGLANSSGLVGKNLMLHPWPMVFGYVDEEVDGDRGPQTADGDVEQGVLRDRPLARLRAGLHTAVHPRHRPGERGDHQHGRRSASVRQGPSPRLPFAALPSHADRRRLRGPAGGAQPRHAGLGPERGVAPIAALQRSLRYRSLHARGISIAASPAKKAVDTGPVSYPARSQTRRDFLHS
jgi:hypothetical protein